MLHEAWIEEKGQVLRYPPVGYKNGCNIMGTRIANYRQDTPLMSNTSCLLQVLNYANLASVPKALALSGELT